MRVLFAPPDHPSQRPKPAARARGRARPAPPPPIPRRLPALAWRQPTLIWTPVALVLALGWPALALREEPGLAQMALTAGAGAFALCLLSLGAAWIARRPPRARRTVVEHMVIAGLIASAAAPLVFLFVLEALARSEQADAPGLTASMAYAMTPLAIMLGLPVALFAGLVFSWVALVKPPRRRPGDAPAARPGEIAVYEDVRDLERIA